jgi:protoporphyrinogen oxidase
VAAVGQHDVAVVGAGMAGLISAWRLTSQPGGPEVVVLEAARRAGGRVLSCQHGGAWVNLGAQFLAGPGPLWQVAEELGVRHLGLGGFHPGLAAGGRTARADRPLRMLATLPVALRDRASVALAGLRILADYWAIVLRRDRVAARAARERLEALSAAERFCGRRAGSSRDQLVRALVRFWLGAEPERAAAAHAAVYLGLSVVPGRRVPRFATPVGGSQALTDALSRRLAGQIVTGAEVTSVAQEEDAVTVSYRLAGRERRLRARGCIVATPADVAASLVRGLPRELSGALTAVRYGTYVVVGVFLDAPAGPPWDRCHTVTPLRSAFQVVINPVIALGGPPGARAGALLAYAGGEPARSLLSRTDREISDAFLADLYAQWPSLAGHVICTVVHRWPAAVPYWEPGGRRGHQVLRAGWGRIWFAGDYLGYPSMQVAAASGIAAADAVRAQLRPPSGGPDGQPHRHGVPRARLAPRHRHPGAS